MKNTNSQNDLLPIRRTTPNEEQYLTKKVSWFTQRSLLCNVYEMTGIFKLEKAYYAKANQSGTSYHLIPIFHYQEKALRAVLPPFWLDSIVWDKEVRTEGIIIKNKFYLLCIENGRSVNDEVPLGLNKVKESFNLAFITFFVSLFAIFMMFIDIAEEFFIVILACPILYGILIYRKIMRSIFFHRLRKKNYIKN